MVLYAENNQSVVCSKAESPRFSEHNEWYCIETTVDDKQIKFYYSKRYQNPSLNLVWSGGDKGFYLYFQLDSKWYKMDAYQSIRYLGRECLTLADYIGYGGTFTIQSWNQRLEGVELFDVAQVALLSEALDQVIKRVNKYNPNIEAQIQNGQLVLINKSSRNYEIPY